MPSIKFLQVSILEISCWQGLPAWPLVTQIVIYLHKTKEVMYITWTHKPRMRSIKVSLRNITFTRFLLIDHQWPKMTFDRHQTKIMQSILGIRIPRMSQLDIALLEIRSLRTVSRLSLLKLLWTQMTPDLHKINFSPTEHEASTCQVWDPARYTQWDMVLTGRSTFGLWLPQMTFVLFRKLLASFR